MENYISKYNNILNKYNILVEPNKPYINQIGLGDLLFYKLLQNNKIVDKIYINIYTFEKYHNEPINALEFKIQLLNDLSCNYGITNNNKKSSISNLSQLLEKIDNFKLEFNKTLPTFNKKYIVFHTKCRFFENYNYNLLKIILKRFYSKYISKYDIILLGERTFPNTWEGKIHNITTIYDELLELKNNNNVIDMTTDSIYDNLDYNRYINDLNIISNAYCNILCGHGGPFVISVCYSKRNISLFDKRLDDINIKYDNRTKLFYSFEYYLQHINSL
jgi:hypothetical protein